MKSALTDSKPPRSLSALPLLLVLAMLLGMGAAGRKGAPGGAGRCAFAGAVDSPAVMQAAGLSVDLHGWAHDPFGIRTIQVFSEGQLIARGRVGVARPDVAGVLGRCARDVRMGFAIQVPVAGLPPGGSRLRIVAVNALGKARPIGEAELRFAGPLALLDGREPLRWDGTNQISGWAISPAGPLKLRVLAAGREVARGESGLPRADLGRLFPGWPHAGQAGFSVAVSMGTLPRGRYPLVLRVEAPDGTHLDLAGPEVWNDEPLGRVKTDADRYVNPAAIDLEAWAAGEGALAGAKMETETGRPLGELRAVAQGVPLAAFENATQGERAHRAKEAVGTLFRGRVGAGALPEGLHRLMVRVTDAGGRSARLPGPLVRIGADEAPACMGERRILYYPGNHQAFRNGFPPVRPWRRMVAGGCLDVGIRGRVEYLRTTRGRRHDYAFDADFPDAGRLRNGREMTGVSLRMLLDLARTQRAPLLVTLDGGVWADNAFAAPDIDAVDMLEDDERTVQWNQFGRSEPDRALSDLPGALDSPELARMMSLNRYNERFRFYKKRNLQAAIREIVAFTRAHPGIDVRINLDPDNYINPWFYMTQWYDYNPDTLRQFREWLFHLGPYADGGELAHARAEPRVTLASASRLAGRSFARIEEVDPPRETIDYADPWQQLWSHFRRHLVAQHYEDLAAWAVEAGLPARSIYTAQTFIQPDVARTVGERATGWTDQAGVSIEGAKPAHGHLGAILYGPASRNLGVPRSGRSLIDNIRGVDPEWGVVELHPATIALRERLPSHEESYQTLLAIANGGARFLSPMWNSRAADQRLHPERFRSYDAMEGTAFEYQLAWWMREMQRHPAGSLRFPFGNELVDSLDGWASLGSTRVKAERGRVRLEGAAVGLASPEWSGIPLRGDSALEVLGSWPQRTLHAELVFASGRRMRCASASAPLRCTVSSAAGEALMQLRLVWEAQAGAAQAVVLDDVSVIPR